MSYFKSGKSQKDLELPDNKRIPQEIAVRKRYSELIFHNQEYQNSHNSYMAELQLLECIERGDPEMMENCWKANQKTTTFGVLAKDWSRNVKNLCIVVIALASRAAIRGGMQAEDAFSLCDCYIQELEECDANLLGELTLRAERHFAEMVRDLHNSSTAGEDLRESPHITRCRDYIFTHLHSKLTVQEIADALYLNANYLCDLFRKHEDMTILQYILREKIKLAQNMLTYFSYTYSEIATYLGFSSQSHMSTHFKKFTGMTLRQYRVKYHMEASDFR